MIRLIIYGMFFFIDIFIIIIDILIFAINIFITNKESKIKYISLLDDEKYFKTTKVVNKSEKLEKEMNNHNLEEWQKKLVREGKYNVDSFEEEEDLEEDDYYYEDE